MIKTFGEAADPPGLQIILAKMRPAPNPHLRMKVPQFVSKILRSPWRTLDREVIPRYQQIY
jgi:hypothetical protein